MPNITKKPFLFNFFNKFVTFTPNNIFPIRIVLRECSFFVF